MPTSPETPRRKLMRAPERSASILAAAAAAFASEGYEATSLDEVAAAAGVSKLILYRHFGSKRELYQAILDRVRERLDGVVQPAGPVSLADADGAMRAAIDALAREFAIAREMPDAYRVLLRHARREPEFAAYAQQVEDRSIRRIDAMLAGVADPVVRNWLAALVSTTVREAFLGWLDSGDPARDDEMVRRTAYVLGAIVGSQLRAV